MSKKQKESSDSEMDPESPAELSVVFFQQCHGTVPLLEWLDNLKSPVGIARCRVVIELLKNFGHQLRRPHADALRDGIRELRARHDQTQYRMLYFFHMKTAVVTHGFIKKAKKVPPKEIERAIKIRLLFKRNPKQHTFVEE